MASPSNHLATSLELLQELQRRGRIAVRARDLSRVHRERLTRNGFLREVMKGWYIPARPDEQVGETTAWYAAYWTFASQYLESRFGDEWCLSADQSLLFHVGDRIVPPQLLVLFHVRALEHLAPLGVDDLALTVEDVVVP